MFADNHASSQVPTTEHVSGVQIALVYIGIAITLPAFVVSAQIFGSLGFANGLAALAISAVGLFIIAMLAMTVGTQSRLSTYAIIQSVFGRSSAIFINGMLAVVLLGWFAVTISIFAGAFQGAAMSIAGANVPQWLAKLIGGALMVALTLYGFRAVEGLSRVAVPLLMIVLVVQFWLLLDKHGMDAITSVQGSGDAIATIGVGASIFIGAFMAGATISPDVSRFARSVNQSRLASLLSFGIGAPLVFFLAGVPALVEGDAGFVATLVGLGLGWPAMFVVIFATFTTNVSNLYSISLGLSNIFTKTAPVLLTVLAGSVGTLVAIAGFENIFVPFLLFLGVAIPPIAGVYIVQGLMSGGIDKELSDQALRWPAFTAWLLASLIAWATTQGWLSISGAPAIDAVVSAGLIYAVLVRLERPATA